VKILLEFYRKLPNNRFLPTFIKAKFQGRLQMNDHIALLIGAFVRWFFHGFKTSYQEETGSQREFDSLDKYHTYRRKTKNIGYFTALILIILMGLLL
jgi:hypothetical protein